VVSSRFAGEQAGRHPRFKSAIRAATTALAAPSPRAAAAELSATTAVVMPRAIPAMARKTSKEEKTQSRIRHLKLE
jgi:hypothetical protein